MTGVTAALASVIVILIQDFARKAVTEQNRQKAQADDLVARALEPLPPARRIVLEAPQGLAVALLDDPCSALELAERLQGHLGDLPLAIGINHGPVTVAEDANRGQGLVGDGIAAALTLAQVATPGRLLASRSFLEVLQADSPAAAARLAAAGEHTDAQVRTHQLYTLDRGAARARHKRLVMVGALACAGILGLGLLGRVAIQGGLFQPPAVIEFHVTPRGEIYIDGVLKGDTPPVQRIEVSAGPHTIEVRNAPHPPLKVEVNPGPKEQVTVRHAFVVAKAAPPREKSLSENAREGWRSFRRGVGF